MAALFQHGEFSATDTLMTRLSLVAQATAIPAFLLVKVLAPAFYARQDTKTPVKAAVAAVVANALFTVLLMLAMLAFTDVGQAAMAAAGGNVLDALGRAPGAHAVLALAIGLAGWTNALQLWWYLRRANVYAVQPGWGRFARQLLLATLGMVLVLLVLLATWDQWSTGSWAQRLWRLLVLVGAGGATYAALLWLQGIRLRHLRH